MSVEVPSGGGPWQQTSTSANTALYISFTGLHFRNANPSFSYYLPGGGSLTPYSSLDAPACVHIAIGQYINVAGNDIDTCEHGLFSDDNNSNAFWNASQVVTVIGNHFHNNGFNDASSCCVHQLYYQSYFGLMEGNRVDLMYSGGTGADVKWRGFGGIFRYNYLDGYTSGTGPQIQMDLTDNQDGLAYVSFEGYLTGGYAQWPSGYDTAGANIIAAYQDQQQQEFVYGNIFVADADQAILYGGDESSGMADRNGRAYIYSNTFGGAAQVFKPSVVDNSYLNQFGDFRNNIVWPIGPPVMSANSTLQFGSIQTAIMSTTTNLFETGSISIASPITGGVYTGSGGPNGWYAGPCAATPCPWPLTLPFGPHLYNLSSPNYLTTGTQPFNSTTYIPPSGSAAIGAGTALAGPPSYLPVRYNFNVSTNTLTPRVYPLTIGAEDQSGSPQASTPTFSPVAGSYGSAQTVTISTTSSGAIICYNTTGSPATNGTTGCTTGTLYSSPVSVSSSETLYAVAGGTGYTDSTVGSAAYVINGTAATPTFSPVAGTYSSAQTITISTVTSGATICYTTDGTTPLAATPGTCSHGTTYSTPVSVAVNLTLKAIATKVAYINSGVGTAAYFIEATGPTFSPVAGTYTGTQSVTLSTATSGCGAYIVWNTTNAQSGGNLTGTSSINPLSVVASETVYSQVQSCPTNANSPITSAAYIINPSSTTTVIINGTLSGGVIIQ
jgi:Chitobiase/beta-hexosaminidase C-terminal domain